jgi:ABC-type glycerol-3-phosphate transport system permease component
MWFWNELLYAMLFLQTNEMRTMTVGVATIIGRFSTNKPLLLSGLFINAIPVVVVFILTQKYFVKGLTAGSIKC